MKDGVAVKRIDFLLAKRFFERYEHLGNCGLGVWHWGAFVGKDLIAAVSFGTACFAANRGAISLIAKQFGIHVYQVCRGGTAPDAPFNTPSYMTSSGLRELQDLRGNCLVVAYADREYNEIGTIYQACNALYTGRTKPKNQSNYRIHGRMMSGWLVRKKFGTRSLSALKLIDPNAVKVLLNRKYRYVFVQVSKQLRKQVLEALHPLTLPYPTRATENVARMDVATLVKRRTQRYSGGSKAALSL